MNTPQAQFNQSIYQHAPVNLPVVAGTTIWIWLKSNGYWQKMQEQPIVVVLNGKELLQKDYGHVIADGDIIELQQYPRGPAVVQVLVWVYYAAVIVTAIYVLTMPEPGIPEAADVKEGSPTYSISAKGNRYRPGTKGPILYGRLRIVPDFDQPAFSTYDTNNDQTLHMLFRITQGEANIDTASITFEDTPLSNFTGYELEVVQPGDAPTLFPSGVIESGDLSNLELDDGYTAAYVANDVGTEVTKIGVDFASPSIANQDKKTGELKSYTVKFAVQAQLIDDSGAAVGSWVTLGTEAFSAASNDAIRRTFIYAVDAGRYQVRVQRITTKNDSQYVHDTLSWIGLKGYLYNPDNISHCTRLAISIRASEQIGNRALSDMSVIATRKLPTWSSEFGWADATQTQSIAWALADICRNSYAGNRSDLNYDLVRIAELDAQLTPLEHYFNAYFDSEGITVWDALIKAGTPGRITPIDKSGFYTFVRDEYQSQAVQAFTMRNIARGSFSIEHAGVLEETADSIIVKIQDEDNDYRTREITCALPDSPQLNPRTIDLFGVTNATRAKELGMFMAACNRYRRKLTPFETGIEGRIPFYGSKIAISHFLLGQEGQRQISGDILAFDGADKIQLSEKMPADYFTDPYIVMVDLDGKPMPAYPVTRISDFVVQVGGSPDWSQIQFDPGCKLPMFSIGDGVASTYYSKVKKIERQGSIVKIEAFIDDDRVYTYGDGVIPPGPVTIDAPQTAAPVLSNLQAVVGGSTTNPTVTLSWSLKNADRTDIQFSDDGGTTWAPIGDGYVLTNSYIHRPDPGQYVYRLAAVNLFRGPWVTVAVDAQPSVYDPPPAPTSLSLRETFTGPTLKLQWVSDSYRHYIEVWLAGVLKYSTTIDGLQWDLDGTFAQQYGIGRAFDVRVYAVGANGLTSASYASISVANPSPASLANLVVTPFLGVTMVAFDWPADADIDGISVWKSSVSGFTPGTANLSVNRSRDPVLKIPVDENEVAYIKVAAVDVWGDVGLNYSGQYTVTGKSVDLSAINAELDTLASDIDAVSSDLAALGGKFPITATDISDGAISTPKLAANAIEADKIAALAVTTAKLAALAVSADKIAANAVTADKIAALAITAGKIAANTITADKMSISQLSAITADLGMVTAGTFQTTSGTGPRVVVSSSGSFPIWIGNGSIVNTANGKLYMDTSGNLVYKGKLSVKSASSGARLELTESSMRVYDASGVLRVKIGDLS